MNRATELKKELNRAANKKQAANLQRFFKTNPGQYGAGDVFLGIMVPRQRQLAKKYIDLKLSAIKPFLDSRIHEFRLVGLLILVAQYQQAPDLKTKAAIVKFYLQNRQRINNWDLVDLTAPKILGDFLRLEPKRLALLDKLAKSKSLWERRIAILATFAFIQAGSAAESLKILKPLLKDEHDLIHKAVGWMLREIGKRVDRKILLAFLDEYKTRMSRTTLRYAIEHLSAQERADYLRK